MSAFVNIADQRFGRLVAIKIVGKYRKGKNTSMIWECRCDCGNIVNIKKSSLGRYTNSCGCLRKDLVKIRGKNNKGMRGLPYGVAAKNKLFDKYKRGAKSRGLEFDLSMSEFEYLTQQSCHYCGISPSQVTNETYMNGQYVYNGIDRVDNTKGYILENCVSCCETCNRAKRIMSVEEFYSWIDRVYHHIHPNKLSSDVFYDWHMMPWSKFADTKIGEQT